MKELFHEISSTMRNNKLRTTLTGFAVSWGLFLLIALLGAGNGLMNSFTGNVEEYVSQNVSIEGWYTSEPYNGYQSGRRISLDEKDVAYTAGSEWENVIENVTRTSESRSDTLGLGGRTVNGYVMGVMPEYQEENKLKMAYGRFLNKNDISERKKVAVIALTQAKELSPKAPGDLIGQWVSCGKIALLVVGIYHTDERDWRRTVAIPYSTFKGVYDNSDKVESITFNLKGLRTLKDYENFEKEYGAAIKRRHDISPTDNRGIWIQNGYTDNLQMSKAQSVMSTAMWILGLLTLISGIVGVSNIMLITVKERTHEFGIRKALGAKPREIMKLIIAESISITAVFGYLGMFLGMLACELMDKTIGQRGVNIGFDEIKMLVNPSVGLDVAVEATILLILAGTLAGAIPAWKAAKVKPIEALRAE